MRSPAPVSSRHGNRLNGTAFSRHCNRPIGISPAPRVCWGSSGRTFISAYVPLASARGEHPDEDLGKSDQWLNSQFSILIRRARDSALPFHVRELHGLPLG